MTDGEFNDMRWKEEREAKPELFKAFMPVSRETLKREEREYRHSLNKPDPSDYNGPF